MDSHLLDNAMPAPAGFVRAVSSTLVVVPHPDDESIGCGGLIALLREAGQAVWVVLVSDGAMSHPQSVAYPAAARRALREGELREALQRLGVDGGHLFCMGLRDGEVPMPGHAGFEPAVAALYRWLAERTPRTVVMPWRRDPHRDHRASHCIATAACARLAEAPRQLEYMVWTAERGNEEEQPRPDEVRAVRLDIAAVVRKKQSALAAHRSQLGGVIHYDPEGFTLSAEMQARCASPVEFYLEPLATPSSHKQPHDSTLSG